MTGPVAGRALGVGAVALLVLPLAGCGAGGDDAAFTVFAAASLTRPFEELAERFEADHEGVEVRLSFAGSADLVAQVSEGAAADVLATADTRTMDDLVEAGLAVGEPVRIATNTLVIAVPRGNPAGVSGLDDLADPGLDLVLCAPEVPCGSAAQQVAAVGGVDLEPDSEEQSVTDVLAKVGAGEADAGLVYVTDLAAASEDVEGVDFPEAAGVVNSYPLVALEGAADPELAEAWVALVTGPVGRAVLAEAGFGAPDA